MQAFALTNICIPTNGAVQHHQKGKIPNTSSSTKRAPSLHQAPPSVNNQPGTRGIMLRAQARLFGRAQRRKGINRGRKEQCPEKHMERGGNRGRCREETVGSVAKKGGGAPRKWGTTPRGNMGARRQETGGRTARKRGKALRGNMGAAKKR